jgi:hypothetical protein
VAETHPSNPNLDRMGVFKTINMNEFCRNLQSTAAQAGLLFPIARHLDYNKLLL